MANLTSDVLAKCQHLVAAGIWPSEQDLPFRAWLSNFDDNDESQAAAKILDRLVYVSEDMAHRAFVCAYVRFLQQVLHDSSPTTAMLQGVHESACVTGIRGEVPNPADSSFAYLRIARDKLGFSETQILELPAAIRRAQEGTLVILVDDTVGTGSQLRQTMTRSVGSETLATALSAYGNVVCITAVAISAGTDALTRQFPRLRLFAGHLLDIHEYAVTAVLPRLQHPEVHDLLARVAPSLEVDPPIDPAYGYRELGLTLAFHDSIPDFSLPILWAPGGKAWSPLMRRHGD